MYVIFSTPRYNTVTGESAAESPPELGHHDPAQNRTFWIDPETSKAAGFVTPLTPLPGGVRLVVTWTILVPDMFRSTSLEYVLVN
jgi:hypothetical protein